MNPSAFVNTPTASTSNLNASTSANGEASTSNAVASSSMDIDPALLASLTTTLQPTMTADDPNSHSNNYNNHNLEDDTPKTARELRQEQKDLELAELLEMMDEWKPIIPDEVTDYFLQKSGFETDDVRVKRLMALAAQRFISSMATDSFQYAKARTAQSKSSNSKAKGRPRTVLTMEDLSAALKEYGVGAERAAYYL